MEISILLGSFLKLRLFWLIYFSQSFCRFFFIEAPVFRLSFINLGQGNDVFCRNVPVTFNLDIRHLADRRLKVDDDQHHRKKAGWKWSAGGLPLLSLFFDFRNPLFYIYYFFLINTGFHVGLTSGSIKQTKNFYLLYFSSKKDARLQMGHDVSCKQKNFR